MHHPTEKSNPDRERVLMNIALQTSGSQFDQMARTRHGWNVRVGVSGDPTPQFLNESFAKTIGAPIVPGDIILCLTNQRHQWAISELVERTGHSEATVRLIGGKRLCNISNEGFDVLRFMPQHLLLTGKRWQLYQWGWKAFTERYNPEYSYTKRCGGVRFEGDQMIIWSRPHVWIQGMNEDQLRRQPRKMTLTWDKNTRLKDIVAAMLDQGFAEDFELSDKDPTEGMAGCATLTKDDLLGMPT